MGRLFVRFIAMVALLLKLTTPTFKKTESEIHNLLYIQVHVKINGAMRCINDYIYLSMMYNVYMYVCVYVCMCVCMYVYMYICIY